LFQLYLCALVGEIGQGSESTVDVCFGDGAFGKESVSDPNVVHKQLAITHAFSPQSLSQPVALSSLTRRRGGQRGRSRSPDRRREASAPVGAAPKFGPRFPRVHVPRPRSP